MSADIVVFPNRKIRLVEQLASKVDQLERQQSKSRVQQLADRFKSQVAAFTAADELAFERKRQSTLLGIQIRQMAKLGGADWAEAEVTAALAELRKLQF